MNRNGRIAFALQTTPFQTGEHHNLRMVRKLANGDYLVCHSGARLVKEYTPQGEAVWQAQVPGAVAFAAVRTPRGTTLVSSLDQVTELDAAGKSVWQFSISEAARRVPTEPHRLALASRRQPDAWMLPGL